MMYPFMTLDDNTEIVHSEMLPDQRVKVYFEKPDARIVFILLSAICPTIHGRISAASPPKRSGATRNSLRPRHILFCS